MFSNELQDAVFLKPWQAVPCWQVLGHQTLSESITGCQTRGDHIIITTLASSRLLNCGNSLVKSDVSMAPVRAPEQRVSGDEPQGTGALGGRGNSRCQ